MHVGCAVQLGTTKPDHVVLVQVMVCPVHGQDSGQVVNVGNEVVVVVVGGSGVVVFEPPECEELERVEDVEDVEEEPVVVSEVVDVVVGVVVDVVVGVLAQLLAFTTSVEVEQLESQVVAQLVVVVALSQPQGNVTVASPRHARRVQGGLSVGHVLASVSVKVGQDTGLLSLKPATTVAERTVPTILKKYIFAESSLRSKSQRRASTMRFYSDNIYF